MDKFLIKKKQISGSSPKQNSEPVESNDGSDSDDESSQETSLPPAKKRKGYDQKFRPEWLLTFGDWLKPSKGNKAFCLACQKNIIGGLTHIQRHEKTDCHQKNYKKAVSTPKISTFTSDKENNLANKVQESELKCVMFLHEHNLPFTLMDHLPKFMQWVCDDSEVAKRLSISRTKATIVTKDCIAKEALECLTEKINDVQAYSLILDETTDVAVTKSLAVVLRFFDGHKVQDHFFGLLEMKGSTAENIYNATMEHLRKHNLPVSKMIGLAADNASVMMGNIRGVQALFKKDVPNLFVLGCVCHSFHLCSSAAANKLPKSVEEFARGIYNYFSNSSKRMQVLKECQSFLNEKPQKMLRPSQVRWLSLEAVVNRILQNWNSLILVFQDAVLSENLHSVEIILNNLRNDIYKIYFTFLSYVLEIVNKLNLEFQSEKCKIYLLNSRVSVLYKTILRNFLKKDYIDNTSLEGIDPKNPRNFCDLNEVYFGAKTELLLSNENIDTQEVQKFKLRALDFYIELSIQIKSRFTFNSPILRFISNFDPKIALSGRVNSIAVESMKYFPQLVQDIDKLDTEWRLLSDCDELKKFENEDFESFWCTLIYMKNDINSIMFPNLGALVKGILCLPHSSAAAERVFSQLNLLKTKQRNRLHVDTCDAILHAKDLLNNDVCYKWKPSARLKKRKPEYRDKQN